MSKSVYLKYQKIFFLLFPLIYISGPLFTELFLLFLVLNCFNNLSLLKKKIAEDNKFIQLFFILIFIQGFIYFPEINYKNLLYLRFYFYYLSIKILVTEKDYIQKNFDLFLRTIIYTFIFLIFFHLLQLTTSIDVIDGRITIPIRQEEIAISIYSKFYPFILLFMLLTNQELQKTHLPLNFKSLAFLTIIMVPVIAILSGERMNTIMLLGFIVLVLIKYRFIYFLYFFSILIIVFFILKNYDFLDNSERFGYIIDRYLNLFKLLNKEFFENSIWGNHFITAINIFRENYLFGTGINMFSTECIQYMDQFKYACANHPHNIYLEIASEAGILSFSLFLIIIASILKIFFIYFFKKNLILFV